MNANIVQKLILLGRKATDYILRLRKWQVEDYYTLITLFQASI